MLKWNEEVARYHIACSHELLHEKQFVSQLNQEQLVKVLLGLSVVF